MPDPKKQAVPADPNPPPPSPFRTWDLYMENLSDLQHLGGTYSGTVPVPKTMQPLSPAAMAALPPFLRNPQMRMGPAPQPDPKDVAHVDMPWFTDKRDIKVDSPKQFAHSVAAHEATHVYQNTRTEAAQPQHVLYYDYGGPDGLRKARLAGQTIFNLNSEQQAQLIEDYYSIHAAILHAAQLQNGHIWPAQAEWFENLKSAYQPFVNQLVGLPEETEKPATTIDTKPPTPGLPPSEITQELQLDPNIAGPLPPIPVWRLR